MDARLFDRMAVALSAMDTRRRLLALLTALPLGGSLRALVREDEVEASHPLRRVQKRAAKRRQRRHHRLRHKRTDRRSAHRRRRNDGRGSVRYAGIRLQVNNRQSRKLVAVRAWYGTLGWDLDDMSKKDLGDGASTSYDTDDRHAGFEIGWQQQIDDNSVFNWLVFVWAENPIAGGTNASVQVGGHMGGFGYVGGHYEADHRELAFGQSAEGAFQPLKFTITRNADVESEFVNLGIETSYTITIHT